LRSFASAKIFDNAEEAIHDLHDGATCLFGGFGLCGIPENIIAAIKKKGTKELTCASNNMGANDFGLGTLLQDKQIKRMISSFPGEASNLQKQYFAGEIEVQLVPQGTLAEKMRAAGAGIPAFYTPTAYGTPIQTGGHAIRLKGPRGNELMSEPLETRLWPGRGGKPRNYVLETALFGDFSFVKGWKADRRGNVIFRGTTKSFNQVVAAAGNTCVVEVEEIVETAEKVETLDETIDSSLKEGEEAFEEAAKKQPLLLFEELPQRACAWSQFKQGTDWDFASMKSDDKEECASACIASKGCTGFEVGPHTSEAYNSITYCALWFNKNCNDEKNMLHLNPNGYVASTYVMIESVTVDVKTEETMLFGTVDVEVEKTETFQPKESEEHYNSIHKKEDNPETTTSITQKKQEITIPQKRQNIVDEKNVAITTSASSVSSFEEFPQLACDFADYTEGSDYMYTEITSATAAAESCATACLNAGDCTGFEIGIEVVRGQYCALWKSGACATKTSMLSIPASAQTVSTFVLGDYHSEEHLAMDGFAVVFLIACACAMLISLLLVGCICYRVISRVCCRRAELNCDTSDGVVAGELVRAKVVRGTPVGQRVDVVVVRGEAVDQK